MEIKAMLIVAWVSCNMSMVQFNKLFASFEMSLHCIASCRDTKLDIFTTKIEKLYKLKTNRVHCLQGDTPN